MYLDILIEARGSLPLGRTSNAPLTARRNKQRPAGPPDDDDAYVLLTPLPRGPDDPRFDSQSQDRALGPETPRPWQADGGATTTVRLQS